MSGVFVDVEWLAGRIGDPQVRIVDARSKPHGGVLAGPTGDEQYRAGHLPGAVHLDYAIHLVDESTPYATRVAPADRFARVLGEHGIGDEALVIAYDDGNVPYAARIVWMLEYYGHERARILAGGFPAWRDAGLPVSLDVPAVRAATFTPRVRPHLRASRDDVLAVAQGRSDAQLLETQRDTTYAQRDRDIKGAVRLSGSRLLEDARGGRIAPTATLRDLVAGARLDPHKRTIVSCGSGVSAAGSYFALKAAGFADVAVYDGSWLEWDHDGLPTVPKTNA